jgi:tetratricopeptide (TPR) repeat protein
MGRVEEAIESYRRAIAARGDFAEAHNNLGSALAVMGKLEDAIACYRQAIALRPGYANAHANLGNAL